VDGQNYRRHEPTTGKKKNVRERKRGLKKRRKVFKDTVTKRATGSKMEAKGMGL